MHCGQAPPLSSSSLPMMSTSIWEPFCPSRLRWPPRRAPGTSPRRPGGTTAASPPPAAGRREPGRASSSSFGARRHRCCCSASSAAAGAASKARTGATPTKRRQRPFRGEGAAASNHRPLLLLRQLSHLQRGREGGGHPFRRSFFGELRAKEREREEREKRERARLLLKRVRGRSSSSFFCFVFVFLFFRFVSFFSQRSFFFVQRRVLKETQFYVIQCGGREA